MKNPGASQLLRMRVRYWLAASSVVLLAGSPIACAPVLTPPPGFVEVEGSSYTFRASTADGLVLAVREIEHEPKGDLEFWGRAIENELRLDRGYALLATRDVKTNKGIVGRQLRFGHDEDARPHLYWVSVFVTDGYLYVVEAGGTKEQVEANEATLMSATAALDTR
jgi:hypothetical protein